MSQHKCRCGKSLLSDVELSRNKWYCVRDDLSEAVAAKVREAIAKGADGEDVFFFALQKEFDVLLRCDDCHRICHVHKDGTLHFFRQEE